jgi:hypothetical protein
MACALTQSPGGELAQPPAMALAARNGMLERIKDTHKNSLAVIHAAPRLGRLAPTRDRRSNPRR